jgi:anti-sigma factor RsiW
MSDSDNDSTTRECGADVAAYALGALEPAEAESFRGHLAQCVVCRDELATFQHVVNALPASVPPHRAPKALRQRVLTAVSEEPRVGPGAARSRAQPRRRWLAMPRPALALGAALAAVAIAVVALQLGSSGSTSTKVYNAAVTGSTGTAQVRVANGRAELVVRDFQPPPSGKIYEVWLSRPNRAPQPTSALFSVTAKGDGDVDVPGSLRGVNQVLVTPEPAGGSRAPTHSPVIRAQLS